MRSILLLLILGSICSPSKAQIGLSFDSEVSLEYKDFRLEVPISKAESTAFEPKHKKLKVVLLTLFLGHFGVHRIYLGTSPNVPVVYSLTLGGGLGLLPLADLIAVLTTKDLSQFENSEKVFMWLK
jgi:hypothetical protein